MSAVVPKQTQRPTESQATDLPLAPKTHLGRWITLAVLLIIVIDIVRGLAVNENLNWPVIGQYLFDGYILRGLVVTIELTVICQVIGTVIGIVFAGIATAKNPILRIGSRAYIWLFRGTPLLVQLLFWYNVALLWPRLGVGVPFTDLGWSVTTNHLVTPFVASVLALALNDGAYMTEIVRGGLLAVPRGQIEAASSIGMRQVMIFRRVIMPQAIRVILPPTGNQTIDLLKGTALVSVIGGGDLLTHAQNLYAQNFLVIPLIVVACIWYLAVVSVMSAFQHFLEQAMGEEALRREHQTLGQRILRNIRPWRSA